MPLSTVADPAGGGGGGTGGLTPEVRACFRGP